jgi:hypothetical protein
MENTESGSVGLRPAIAYSPVYILQAVTTVGVGGCVGKTD